MSWQAYPLSRIAIDLQPGFARQPKSGENSMPQLRTNNVSPEGRIDLSLVKAVPTSKREIERYSLLKGDILFNNTNSVTLVGKTAFFDLDSKHFLFSNHMTRIRVNEVIADPRFIARYLYWIWKTGGFRMMVTRWVNQAAINKTMLGSVNIQLPPISEQRRIVEILDQADALRKKRVEADAKAARILPALFYKMFGDPATNSKGLDKKRLGDLIKVRSGNFLPAKNMGPGGQYPVYGGNGINGYHSECMFEQPVIVLGRVGAYCGAIYYSDPNCWVTDNALYVAEQSDDLHPRYLTEALRVANLNQYAGRAGQPLISGSRIYPVEILVPPPEDQETFARSIVNLHRDEKRRKDADDHIQKLFSVFLHRAFTGDLTAKWREAHMKELLAEMEEQAKALEAPLVMKGSAKAKSKQQPDQNMQIKRRKKLGIEYRHMENYLLSFRPAYLKIQEDMERLSHALKPSYLSIYEQMSQALAPMRKHHLEITQAFKLSGLASLRLAEIAHANNRWQDLINQAALNSQLFEDFKHTHQTWIDAFKPRQDNLAQIQAMAKLSLCDVAQRLTFTERLFAGIDFESLKRIAIPEPAVPDLERVILNFTSTYKNLADSIQTIPEVTRLPTYVLPGATREIFTTGYALDAICISEETDTEENPVEVQLVTEVEQETSGCITLLQSVDPALARPYIGAHDALHSSNTDRARHILTSLREFWNHLLRKLAPDEMIMGWLSGDRKDLLHKGRPTRRARVLYVCRKFNHDPLTDLVVQDTRALVKLVEFFNRVHELDSELTDNQLKALLLRTDSWLMYILQIWEGTK